MTAQQYPSEDRVYQVTWIKIIMFMFGIAKKLNPEA